MSGKDTLYACQQCGITSVFPFYEQDITARCAECEELADWDRIDDRESTESDDEDLFDEAKSVVQDRENRHGSIYETHAAIADYFAWYVKHRFGVELDFKASDAANMLDGGLKGSRKVTGEMNRDTYRDAMGYNYCAWECRKEE